MGLPRATRPGLWQLVDLQPVDLAVTREAEQGVVRVSDEEFVDEVLILDAWPPIAAPTAPLRLVV